MSFHAQQDKGLYFNFFLASPIDFSIVKYVLVPTLKNGKVCPVNEAYQKSQWLLTDASLTKIGALLSTSQSFGHVCVCM